MMNTEVQRRAAVHGALGEPIRLGIVDRLGPGDASPGELAEAFELGTNLLAHHLKVLEDAGVIRRVRSEGDRRRSYVQLCLDDPLVRAVAAAGRDAVASPGPVTWSRVVFVCTANSARSQLAAASWNRVSTVPALSAGTHPGPRIHPRATAAARRHGLRLGRNRPVALKTVLRGDDLVIAVCDNAHEELDPTRERLHWSVPDPVRVDTDEAFEAAYRDIDRRVERLADAVSATAVTGG
jgi:protein-tyrosine-phosphatase/DNA-binding transcriptional ArsR family regulator